ncbi:sensor histidine kinase [Hyalangium versicolor]|uniref:sensor histidine kinase n=1 Tax=Hyalangium versicolor TaxID=2861190 RepID=UPI001CCD69C0|nr:PAS domain-containing sensor histidine kinase [Hyalangium versicolor]
MPVEKDVDTQESAWLANERLRLMVASLKDYSFTTLDTRGFIQNWNAGGELITGYGEREVVGKHVSMFYPPEEVQAGKVERVLSLAESEGRVEEEGWRSRRDGSRIWVNVVTSAVRDRLGRLVGFSRIGRDLSSRHEMEERVRESEELFRLLVERVEDYAIFMVDIDGRVLSWNDGAQRIKGYSVREILGQRIDVFYPQELRLQGRPEALLREAAERGRAEDEGWRVRKDGSRFWADVVITAIRERNGQLRGFTQVTRDLSERREAEERIRQSEERYRALVEGVKDYAIFMLDPAGHVLTWNEGAERIKGYRRQEIIGRHFSLFYSEEEVRAGKCELMLERAKLEGRAEDEGWRLRKDGTRFWANVIITALRDSAGQLIGFTKVTRDMTERRRQEEQRLRLLQAQDSIRIRDEFLTVASHELKTPLTALQLQLQSLRDRIEEMDKKMAQKLDRASRSGERLARLVETLLDVSLIVTGRLELNPRDFNLAEAVIEVVESMRVFGKEAGCELRVKVSRAVHGAWDRLRVEQVLSNLLANAFKYAAGTPVEVMLSQYGEEAVIEVKDGGPGIPEGDLSRIFERFERAASVRHYGGMGLGLYVVREIVEAHGGRISARNDPAGGARFTACLPLVPRPQVSPGPEVPH